MNRKFRSGLYLLIAFAGAQFVSCSDSFLNQPAKGSLSPTQLTTKAGVEQALIGAYSNLAGDNGSNGDWAVTYTNWVYGSVVGGESFKGSNSGDQSAINPLASFTPTATNGYLSDQWLNCYDGVNRANTTLKLLAAIPDGGIEQADIDRITAEARFLRGLFHFEAYMMWKKIPYVDETVEYGLGNYRISNSEDPLPKILADFDYAATTLAATGMSKGRANKWAALAYKAKVLMHQKAFATAMPILQDIYDNGVTPGGANYELNANFRNTFDASNDNSPESVFALQSSVNDGSGAAHANPDLVLNYAYLSSLPVNCCGFNQPSYDLANSYRVNGSGLPLLQDPNAAGGYNDAANVLKDELWLTDAANTDIADATDDGLLDPRIDWTLGRTGVPYFDWGVYSGPPWVRLLSDGGPYTVKKYTFPKTEVGTFTDGSSWTAGYSAVNQYLIRFADVILWLAECKVEANDLGGAMDLVNEVRARAQDQDSWVKISDDAGATDWEAYLDPTIASHFAGDYSIELYTSFADQDEARMAVHMERKLELAMEGHRFFDLVRWGETTNAGGSPINLQQAFDYNGTLNNLAQGVTFTVGKSENFPIPQNQIDLNIVDGVSVLEQNPGY